MFHFTRQVQAATDHARNYIALLARVDARKFDDNEQSIVDPISRVQRTLDFIGSITAAQIDDTEDGR